MLSAGHCCNCRKKYIDVLDSIGLNDDAVFRKHQVKLDVVVGVVKPKPVAVRTFKNGRLVFGIANGLESHARHSQQKKIMCHDHRNDAFRDAVGHKAIQTLVLAASGFESAEKSLIVVFRTDLAKGLTVTEYRVEPESIALLVKLRI
jgi:hypothetical protein